MMNGAHWPWGLGPIDVTRCFKIKSWVVVTRLGNDNHSHLASIKKPDGFRAWNLETIDVSDCVFKWLEAFCNMLGTSDYVTWSPRLVDNFKAFVISCRFHFNTPWKGRLTPHPHYLQYHFQLMEYRLSHPWSFADKSSWKCILFVLSKFAHKTT